MSLFPSGVGANGVVRAAFLLAVVRGAATEDSALALEQRAQKATLLRGTMQAAVVSAHDVGSPTSVSKVDGHFLTNTELTPISDVACLQAKQRNPAVVCVNGTIEVRGGAPGFGTWMSSSVLGAGNFPNYKDTICNSGGEYLCDVDSVLTAADRDNINAEMKSLREHSTVTCGRLGTDPIDKLHRQPFYLGVAILQAWPMSSSDTESLQQFGRSVAARWNMDEPFVGSTIPFLRCPTTGMLLILPDRNEAYLSTESCEFICQAHGGPEVETAASTMMRLNGTAAGVLAGLREAYAVLKSLDAQGHKKNSTTPETMSSQADTRLSPDLFVFAQRAVFVFSVCLCLGSLAVAVLVCYLAPGLLAPKHRRR